MASLKRAHVLSGEANPAGTGRCLARACPQSGDFPSGMTQMRTLRTVGVCGFTELPPKLFHKSFPLPLCAIAFGDFSGTRKSMALGGVVTDTDSHIPVERAHCCGTGR